MENIVLAKSGLRPYAVYLIRSVSTNRYLRCNDIANQEQVGITINLKGPDYHGAWLYWYFQPLKDGTFTIRNTLTQRFLRCNDNANNEIPITAATRGLDYHGEWLHWNILNTAGDTFTITNPYSNRSLRAGISNDESIVPTASKNPLNHSKQLQWTISPVVTAKLNVRLQAFHFIDAATLIDNAQITSLRDMVDSLTLVVTNETLDSEVSKTFTKTFQETFNFEVNSTFGVEASLQILAGIPLFQEKITVGLNAQWGANSSWTTQKTHQYQISSTLKVNQPGTFRLSGWVDIVENIKLEFLANGVFTAKGLGFVDGKLKDDYDLNAQYIEFLMSKSKDNSLMNVVGRTDTVLTVQVGGNLVGTFGLASYTKTERIA